jgi:hypothetical protein
VDSYDETKVTGSEAMAVSTNSTIYLETEAHDGPERRGLGRLRVMTERCRDGNRLALLFVGD